MLKTLSNIEPHIAQRALSEITKKFIPSPTEHKEDPHNSLHDAILSEIIEILKIHGEPTELNNSQKIIAFLLNEMNSLVLNERKIKNARERLGERGDLALTLYEFKFGDDTSKFKSRGIEKSEILKTVKNPDRFTHLLRGQEIDEGKAPISIYVRSFRFRQENIFLLVETKRKGDVQLISTAWKIFPKDIGMDLSDDNALSILKRFVDYYGIEFSIGNSYRRKFYLYETVPMNNNRGTNILNFNAGNIDFESSFVLRVSPLSLIEISMAYIINTTKYYKDLRSRGMPIKS
jgi:hypothetical protein